MKSLLTFLLPVALESESAQVLRWVFCQMKLIHIVTTLAFVQVSAAVVYTQEMFALRIQEKIAVDTQVMLAVVFSLRSFLQFSFSPKLSFYGKQTFHSTNDFCPTALRDVDFDLFEREKVYESLPCIKINTKIKQSFIE